METNKKLPLKETETNPSLFLSLLFEKEVDQWIGISKTFNVLILYALPAILKDGALSEDQDHLDIEELLFFKSELDKSLFYTLVNIPKK